MCSGGGPSGPSSSDMKKQEKRQKKSERRMRKQYRRTEKAAQTRHEETMAANDRTFREGQYNAFKQFQIAQVGQQKQAAQQMQMQMAQFAMAQKQQMVQMQQQMQENARLAEESHRAQLKAQGLQPTVDTENAARVKPRGGGANRSEGTGQLVTRTPSTPGLSIGG